MTEMQDGERSVVDAFWIFHRTKRERVVSAVPVIFTAIRTRFKLNKKKGEKGQRERGVCRALSLSLSFSLF